MTYSSIRERVDALPEPERSARRMLYSDFEWEHSWKLNAWDHQVPPAHDDWQSWTVIGPPRTGCTQAGLKWMESNFLKDYRAKMLIIVRYQLQMTDITDHFHRLLSEIGATEEYRYRGGNGSASFKCSNGIQSLLVEVERGRFNHLRGFDYDYVWADNVTDASMYMDYLPRTKHFVFTNPIKLPAETVLSRAGA